MFILHKGKIRKAIIKQVNARLTEGDIIDESHIHSISFEIPATKHFPEDKVILDLGQRRIEHWVFFSQQDAIDSVTSEINV